MIKELSWGKGLGIVSFVAVTGIFGWYLWLRSVPGEVVFYDHYRDRTALEAIFHQNWYWLDTRPHSEAFDSFKERLDKTDRGDADALWWKVYREHGFTTGFVAYYMLSPIRGKILFLAVDHLHRARGQANALMDGAKNDLIAHGARIIELVTKINNYRARNLYEKLGYSLVSLEDGHAHFEYTV